MFDSERVFIVGARGCLARFPTWGKKLREMGRETSGKGCQRLVVKLG